MKTSVKLVCSAIACFVLVGCAGSVRHSELSSSYKYQGQKVGNVTVNLSPEVQAKLNDNIKFSQAELTSNIVRRLQARGMYQEDAKFNVKVNVTDIRVRGTFTAVMFGFMAGDDHIDGDVSFVDQEGNKEISKFQVTASYALGGFGGGQDNARMNWLYEKFSELLVADLRDENAK